MKTSGELEKEFVTNIVAITGKDLPTWLDEIKAQDIDKRNDIIKWLKTEKNLGHVNASWLAGIHLNNGKLVYQDQNKLLNDQLKGNEEMKLLYKKLSEKILYRYPDTKLVPKKTYISFTAKREYVALNVKRQEIRIALDLGPDQPFDNYVQKAKLTGPMPRLSHMIVLKSQNQINELLFTLMERSYSRVN